MKHLIKLLLVTLTLIYGNAQATGQDYSGVWQAKRNYDEAVQGVLSIRIDKGRVTGNIANLKAKAKIDNNRFTLDFGEGKGRFEGHWSGKQLTGHWVQPKSRKYVFASYASPVRFTRNGKVFQGKVDVLQDTVTLYMVVSDKTDDGWPVNIINPEHNAGRFFTKAKLMEKDGVVTLVGQLRWQDSEQTHATGQFDEQNQHLALHIPLYGGSYDFAKADETSQYWPLGATKTYQYRMPEVTDKDWPVRHASQLGMKTEQLAALVQSIIDNPPTQANQGAVHAVLVARKGKLVLEEYFNGYTRHSLHDTRSASKSLTGSLVGMAQQAGVDIQLTDELYPVMAKRYPDLDYSKAQRAINLEHVLSMSTGLDCDDNDQNSPGQEDKMQQQSDQPDWFRYMLDLKQVAKPGEKAAYCSGGISLAGGMLAQKAGFWLPEVFERYFAKPLGVKHYRMNLMANGEEGYSGGGLRITARDFLKLGQLMLDGGKWQGKQLISDEYAKKAVAPITQMFGQQYGLGWWRKSFDINGESVEVIYAGGNGGQQIVLEPKSGLAILFFGGAYSTKGTFYARDTLTPKYLLQGLL